MATYFRNKIIKVIGTQKIEVFASDGSTNATVLGINIANVTEFAINVNIYVKDDTSVEGYFMKDVMIVPHGSFKGMLGGEKLIIPSNNSLLIQSNLADSCDAIISYVDIQ